MNTVLYSCQIGDRMGWIPNYKLPDIKMNPKVEHKTSSSSREQTNIPEGRGNLLWGWRIPLPIL
jgi:hypothetical protein